MILHLKCRCHECVVDSCLGEEGEVDVEAAQVHRHRDGDDESSPGHKLFDELQITVYLILIRM